MKCVYTIVTCYFCLFATTSWAQQEKIEIIGEIINNETLEPVPFVHIINQTIQRGTTSNGQGRFMIRAMRKDTLIFSAIGFDKFAFVIREDVTTDRLQITISLNPSTMELETVEVFAYRNEEALKQALLEMELPIEDNARVDMPNNVPRNPKYATGSGVRVGGPISGLAKALKLGKSYKEQAKLDKMQQFAARQRAISAKYNPVIVKEITGLPQDRVEEFMEFCKLGEDFLLRSTEYDIIVAVNQCMVDFMKEE